MDENQARQLGEETRVTNILLTGFMGAGKTTVGRKLAKRLGFMFIDTDYEIEEEQGCGVSEIFKYGGEECFRDMETRLLVKLAETQKTIIATGGGMILREQNRKLMKNVGELVYLRVTPEELFLRLRQDRSRPLLKNKNPEMVVEEMLKERGPLYERAKYIVDTGTFSPQQIASEIIRQIYKK